MKYEIWAEFNNGLTAKVETHKSAQSAQAAVDAMNSKNNNDLRTGYGFPHGVPTYRIKTI